MRSISTSSPGVVYQIPVTVNGVTKDYVIRKRGQIVGVTQKNLAKVQERMQKIVELSNQRSRLSEVAKFALNLRAVLLLNGKAGATKIEDGMKKVVDVWNKTYEPTFHRFEAVKIDPLAMKKASNLLVKNSDEKDVKMSDKIKRQSLDLMNEILEFATEEQVDAPSEEEALEQLENLEPIGLANPDKTNCFLNSAFQLAVHTKLAPRIINNPHVRAAIKQQVEGEEADLTRLRRDLGGEIGEPGQHDVTEAVQLLLKGTGKTKMQVCRYGIDEKGKSVPSPQPQEIITVAIPDKPLSLQDMMDKMQRGTIQEGSFDYTDEDGQAQTVTRYREEATFTELDDYLLISPKRCDQNGKNKTKIPVGDGSLTIKDQEFQLRGYILHHGDKPTSGHYVAVIYRNDKWYLMNDAETPTELTDEQARRGAKRAYLLYYEKNEE